MIYTITFNPALDYVIQVNHFKAGQINRNTKEDIFYYVYGILHSPSYREKFQADLKKVLPRLPLVDEPRDFHTFSNAGKQLAELHLNYENIPANPNVKVIGREKNNFIFKFLRYKTFSNYSISIYNNSDNIFSIINFIKNSLFFCWFFSQC